MTTDRPPATLARDISQAEIDAYNRDGAAVLRGVLDMEWIGIMRKAIDRILAAPGPAAIEYTPAEKPGRYYGDFFLWRRDPDFRALMMGSPMPQIAARVMGSEAVHFFYDQLLVKEPGTAEPTPWHQDLPYWPVRGNDILSVWIPFDPASIESGVVEYLKGSHTWGKMYAPATFGKNTGFAEIYAKLGLEPVPDIEAQRDRHDIVHWDVEPGDVIIHHPLTLHYASGNASSTGRRRGLALRYLGDDAVYDARPGTFMDNPKILGLLPGFDFADGERLVSDLFPSVWPRQDARQMERASPVR